MATFSLVGKVSDENTATIAGATVSAFASGAAATATATATTATDGSYTLNLLAGSYTVTASKPSWTTRSQSVTLTGNATLNFGGSGRAYFLSDTPEISSTLFKEDSPGGPLTITCTLSEPLPAASQAQFTDRFQVNAVSGAVLFRPNQTIDPRLAVTTTWDASGKVFTFRYNAARYLASSATTPATYQVYLRQGQVKSTNSASSDPTYEDMGIVDQEGQPLGYGRADYAFVTSPLFLDPSDLNNSPVATTFALRAWRLTHQGVISAVATVDAVPVGLVSARTQPGVAINGGTYDVLELHLAKAINVVRDRDNLQFTRLDKAKNLVTVLTSQNASGTNSQALGASAVLNVRFSQTDQTVVYLDFPKDAFLNARWVDVTLGSDFIDPVGNAPDPKANHLTITN